MIRNIIFWNNKDAKPLSLLFSFEKSNIWFTYYSYIYMLSSIIGYMNANHVHKKENSIIFMRLIS